MKNELPKRKPTRLSNFDYSTPGAYFITICTEGRKRLLSDIIRSAPPTSNLRTNPVGEGLAPPEKTIGCNSNYQYDPEAPKIVLKPCGVIAKEQLLLLEKRYPNLTVEDYVIMPDHIHAILYIHSKAGGASPSPTDDARMCEAGGASCIV